jgi:glutathione S-transferase
MKLYYSSTSPYVRKCLVVAHELGLFDRIEQIAATVHPIDRNADVVKLNPLGKLPTFVTDGGTVLYDSRVIVEYLNDLGEGDIIPSEGAERWEALVSQARADGVLDAALLVRYEMNARPEALRWTDWITGQLDKVACGLADIEARAHDFGDRVDIGTIATGCALGYLDLRFPQLNWRDGHANTAAWFEWFGGLESMVATRAKT